MPSASEPLQDHIQPVHYKGDPKVTRSVIQAYIDNQSPPTQVILYINHAIDQFRLPTHLDISQASTVSRLYAKRAFAINCKCQTGNTQYDTTTSFSVMGHILVPIIRLEFL
jgi:hypothetical protein